MINSQEVNEFLIVFDVFVGNFDGCLQVKDVVFFALLALEDALDSFLTLAQFLKLMLVIALLAFSVGKHFNHLFSTLQSLVHTLYIKELSF